MEFDPNILVEKWKNGIEHEKGNIFRQLLEESGLSKNQNHNQISAEIDFEERKIVDESLSISEWLKNIRELQMKK
jgi:hypothetical protein